MDEKVLTGILIIVLLFGVAAFYIHNNGPPEFMNKLPLVEEYSESEIVVVEQAITPSPGSVWKLEQTPSGLMFKQSDSRLVEELELQNVTLQGGDAVAAILHDWYFDGQDDAVVFPVTLNGNSMDWVVWGLLADDNTDHYHKIGGFGASSISHTLLLEDIKYSDNIYAGLVIYNVTDGTIIKDFYLKLDSQYYGMYGEHRVHVDSSTFAYYFNGELQGSADISAYTSDEYMPYRAGDTSFALGARTERGGLNCVDYVRSRIGAAAIYIDNRLASLVSATFFNGTHYFDLITGNTATVHGDPARMPTENPTLWLAKSLASDGKLHLRFFPANTVIKIKDRVTGQEWTFTVTGVQNGAGLIEDYAITPPTSTPVDIVAYIPSERVRFYAPDGFTIKIQDSTGYTTENVIQDGKVTLAGGTTVKLIAESQDNLVLDVEETPTVYRILVTRSDGTPTDAYIWIYDPSGNLVDYGLAENGVYEIAKNPNLPDGIRVEAKALDSGIYYTGSKDFRLAEEQTVTVVPQSGLLSNNNFVIALAAAIFLGMIAIAVIVRGR